MANSLQSGDLKVQVKDNLCIFMMSQWILMIRCMLLMEETIHEYRNLTIMANSLLCGDLKVQVKDNLLKIMVLTLILRVMSMWLIRETIAYKNSLLMAHLLVNGVLRAAVQISFWLPTILRSTLQIIYT